MASPLVKGELGCTAGIASDGGPDEEMPLTVDDDVQPYSTQRETHSTRCPRCRIGAVVALMAFLGLIIAGLSSLDRRPIGPKIGSSQAIEVLFQDGSVGQTATTIINNMFGNEAPAARCSSHTEDCRKTMCCSEAGLQCYRKTRAWGGCRRTCTPGGINPLEEKQFQTPWDCKPLGKRATAPLANSDQPGVAMFAKLTSSNPKTYKISWTPVDTVFICCLVSIVCLSFCVVRLWLQSCRLWLQSCWQKCQSCWQKCQSCRQSCWLYTVFFSFLVLSALGAAATGAEKKKQG
jgi:hypothetical protein